MQGPVRILLVDDCETLRIGLRQILEGAENITIVGEACDGTMALPLIEATRPNVILFNSRLSDMPVAQLVKELGQQKLPVHLVAFSADGAADSIRELLDNGVKGYVLQTEPSERIIEAVRTVAAERKWFSEGIRDKMNARLANPTPISEELTAREAQVLELLARGLADEEIGRQLVLSKPTTRFHLQNIYAKLGVNGSREAIAWVYQNGWLKRNGTGQHPS